MAPVGEALARDLGPLVALGFRADRVPRADAEPRADGNVDYAFRVRLSGEVVALVLTASDVHGKPWGLNWWDTYRGDAVIPAAIAKAYHFGRETWTVGVYDHGDHVLNPDGTLPRTTFHDEVLTLYISDSGSLFWSGYTITLYVVRPDGTLDRTTTSLL